MPTIFSHAVFAVVLGKAGIKKSVTFRFWFLAAVCAIVPDADVITRSFGAERGSLFSHRGFTHSFVFALLFGSLIAFIAHRFLKTGISYAKLFLFFALATFSHPFLDMLTDGGSGVALFAPFSNERFFLPYRPIEVSPIGLGFFSGRGIIVILSEIVWVWIPAFAVLLITTFVRRNFRKK
jgi:inner membrane protein